MDNIKLFITDIDGVWTDGGMYYDKTGNEFKKFNTYDSAGVVLLNAVGIPTAIITGENTEIVSRRAEKLNIPFVYQGVTNKLSVARKLCKQLGIGLSEVAFIGDDINDINLLQKVKISACPKNASDYIKNEVDWMINVNGGSGAYRAFVEKYLILNNLFDKALIIAKGDGQ